MIANLEKPSSTAAQRTVATYLETVKRHFRFMKQPARLADAMARSIELPDGEGYLLPVCELHTGDSDLIGTLAKWREENSFAYPTQFTVTHEGTAKWLRAGVLENEGRVLFLVINRFGQPIGHLGFANALNDQRSIEIDNVIRGVKGGYSGIMSSAMKALLAWAEEMLLPQEVFLRVFSDNDRAIGFYERLGFVRDTEIPLVKEIAADSVSYRAAEASETPDTRSFLRMAYKPQTRFSGQELILTAGPSISEIEVAYTLDAVKHGWNSQWSGYLTRFEREFADYLGVRHAIATSSGTGALHIALLALGVGPGDEVIVPDLTWVATGNAVVYTGATPVFADVQMDSWCMDPDSFENLITDRTKAVMPVHLYGHPAQMDRIMEIARKHRIPVVEDAAPSIGAEFKGQKTGTFGEFAMFSFQGAKLAVTGEGGILVTNDDALYERAHLIWDQGRVPGTFWIQETGWKYKMANVQAAIGLAQLQRVDQMVEAKRRIFEWYREDLSDLQGITLNQEASWARSIYWMTSILLDESLPITREEMRTELKKRNVDTRPVFPAISRYPMWPRVQSPQPNSFRIGEQAINLPGGVCLSREKVQYICREIRNILSERAGKKAPLAS